MEAAVILAFLSAIVSCAMAITVAVSARRSIAQWSFAAGMAVLAAESLLSGLAADATAPRDMLQWQNWRLLAAAFLPGTWLLFSLSYARGNYRECLAKWRFLLIAGFAAPIALAALFHGRLFTSLGQANAGGPSIFRLGAPGLSLYLLVLLSSILVLTNLERTFRAAVGTMRWRIKFMVLGLGVLFAVLTYTSSQVLLFRTLNLSLQEINSAALLVTCALVLRSLFRTGHFEVNAYPLHSMRHGSLTILLAGIYLFIVGVLARLVVFLGGDASFALKAFLVLVCLVLLTIVLMSDRVRLYTKRFVSRHFQRPLYDYRTVWRTFVAATARCVEQTDLCAAVAKLVSDIFQALSVTIWLLDEKKEKLLFATSTALSASKAEHLALDRTDTTQVISAMAGQPNPVDVDSSKELWASVVRRLHPVEFAKGGHRVCVPLLAGDELLGLMTLGDRVGGVPFSVQDFDLVKSVSDQAAASLLNIQLSQKLSQVKQLEAFQAMSAFFVHDLKNTASALSLMLQNLPVHFADPNFREDALRGISKTVTHINDLIARLGLLRRELTVQAVECNLNEIVQSVVSSIEFQASGLKSSESKAQSPKSEYQKPGDAKTLGDSVALDLHAVPRVLADRTQIQNVLTNLMLNAKEAIGADGKITVETNQRNGWVVLSVVDNGCGMNREFVERSLFRPFQSTKKKGIGIGMFQCKIIVEAHRGRIEVESEPGKGTSFRVLLPLA